jgi:hypothetical protein
VHDFSICRQVQNSSGTHHGSPPIGRVGSFPGLKRPKREANISTPGPEYVVVQVCPSFVSSWDLALRQRSSIITFKTNIIICRFLALLHHLGQEDASNSYECLMRPGKEPVDVCVVDETRKITAAISESFP